MKFTMINEDDDKPKSIWQRSWTIRTLKHEYGVIVITLLGVAVSFLCLYTFVKAERMIFNEMVVTVSPWNYFRGIRTAQAASLTTKEYIQLVFGKDAPTALAVMTAESHGNAYAINKNKDGSYDLGCWQLNDHWQKFTREQAFDCKWSTDKAFEIYKKWGNSFNAWSVYKNNSYKKYVR